MVQESFWGSFWEHRGSFEGQPRTIKANSGCISEIVKNHAECTRDQVNLWKAWKYRRCIFWICSLMNCNGYIGKYYNKCRNPDSTNLFVDQFGNRYSRKDANNKRISVPMLSRKLVEGQSTCTFLLFEHLITPKTKETRGNHSLLRKYGETWDPLKPNGLWYSTMYVRRRRIKWSTGD